MQLEKTEAQLDTATAEKSQLLDLLSAEKEEKRALMPPVEERKPKSRNWLLPARRCAVGYCFSLFYEQTI